MARKREPVASFDLEARLKEHGLEPIYLIEGRETFLRRQALSALRRHAGIEVTAGGSIAESVHEGGRAQVADVLDDLRTLPFFSKTRLVVVEEAQDFLGKHAEVLGTFLEEVGSATGRPFANTLVLISARLDGRFAITKRFREAAVLVPCDSPDEAGLLRFLDERARFHGRPFARGAAGVLLDRFSGGAGACVELGVLDSEVAKLCASGQGPITVEQVVALATELGAEDSFAIVNACGRGDARAALEALRSVLRDGAIVDGERRRDPRGLAPMIVGLFSWDLSRIFKGCALLREGRSAQDVITELKAWRDRDVLLARMRRSMASEAGLRRLHELLREADARLKDSGDPVEILTMLVASAALMNSSRKPVSAAR